MCSSGSFPPTHFLPELFPFFLSTKMSASVARLRAQAARRAAQQQAETEFYPVDGGEHFGASSTMYGAHYGSTETVERVGKWCCLGFIFLICGATLIGAWLTYVKARNIEKDVGLDTSTSCSDGNVCTVDEVDEHGGCINRPEKNGVACTDGCHTATSSPTCQYGVCQGGTCAGTCTVVGDCPTASTHFSASANTTCFANRCLYTFDEVNIPDPKILSGDVAFDGGLLTSRCDANIVTTSTYADCFKHTITTTTGSSNGIDLVCVTYFGCSVD